MIELQKRFFLQLKTVKILFFMGTYGHFYQNLLVYFKKNYEIVYISVNFWVWLNLAEFRDWFG